MSDVLSFFDESQIADPYPRYARWRSNHPIWREPLSGRWVLSRHQDVFDVLKDHRRFSSSGMGAGLPLPLITDDPPRHTQLRSIVNKAFTTAMLKSMEPAIARVANDIVEALPEGRDFDVVERLTTPLPVTVIARMMGIPEERRADFKRWSDALTGTLAGASPEARRAEMVEMAEYFRGLVPERKRVPGNDLVSAVANAQVDGVGLSEWEIVGFNILLLIAGNETTTNLLGNLLNLLADRPELWRRLRAQPELIDAAIEEILRYDSPVQFLMRTATEDVVLHGTTHRARRSRDRHDGLGEPGRPRGRCAGRVSARSAAQPAPVVRLRHSFLHRRAAGAYRSAHRRRSIARARGVHRARRRCAETRPFAFAARLRCVAAAASWLRGMHPCTSIC